MKLSYRGVGYDYNPPTLEVTEGEILGKYRGANWRCRTMNELPTPQPASNLTYRGVSYTKGSAPSSRPTAVSRVATARASRFTVPAAMSAPKEIDRIHRANLERNLERRLQVARRQGNQQLISLLEAERDQLTL